MPAVPAAMPDDADVIQSLGRRLRVVFQGAGESDDALRSSPDDAPVVPLLPLVEFVAYAYDCVLYGRVRLAADRLTDMLNTHDEFELVDVMVERLRRARGGRGQGRRRPS